MAIPASFEAANQVARGPSEDSGILPMPVRRLVTQFGSEWISCWKFTPEEIRQIVQSEEVFLSTLTAHPVAQLLLTRDQAITRVRDLGEPWVLQRLT